MYNIESANICYAITFNPFKGKEKSMKKNYSKLVKGILFGVVTLSLLGMLLIPSLQGVQQKTSANSENGRAEYLARVNKGVSAVGFASSTTEVQAAINNMDNYITERSGLRFSPVFSDKLSSLESAALSGNQALISFDKLVDTITDVGLKRLSQLNDVELDQAVSSTYFETADLPQEVKENRSLAIRPGHYADIEKEKAVERLKTLQSSKVQLVAKSRIRDFIRTELTNTLVDLAAASPEKFGQNWDLANNRPGKGLTPSQAYLLSYSLVSGDLLNNDRDGLDKTKRLIYDYQVKTLGYYPNPNNYLPYGNNGYVYSSPVNIFFNEKVQLELLEQLTK